MLYELLGCAFWLGAAAAFCCFVLLMASARNRKGGASPVLSCARVASSKAAHVLLARNL